ncbi:hypothetical protein SLEP1_g57538 [Rubroshorea leprosula]|uniref:Uncharacterized protein n=1 Tax=Rubroshorea leprosula TaxID=152421 RepID=A0AAV5MLZ8_9ROSI|nr:hypothetical protein SLEP1_g57538 [Rubroshorea leprosula]
MNSTGATINLRNQLHNVRTLLLGCMFLYLHGNSTRTGSHAKYLLQSALIRLSSIYNWQVNNNIESECRIIQIK